MADDVVSGSRSDSTPEADSQDESTGSQTVGPQTFGELIRAIAQGESARKRYIEIAEKYEAQRSPESIWYRAQAGACEFHADPSDLPGVDRLMAICQAEFGSGLTGENLARLRSLLFLRHQCEPIALDAMKIQDVVDLFLAASSRIEPDLTLLDRFPATQAGHVAFLEFVRDEVHYAAKAKQQQFERGYPNATIESMVRGVKWTEARVRLAALSNLPEIVLANIGDTLHRELTAGSIEQIEALLRPAVRGARDSLEQARVDDLARKTVVVATAGDLWKAYSEGKQPCFQSSGISIRSGENSPKIACTDTAAEAKRVGLELAEALVTAEGGDKAAAMEKLIARVQLHAGMDKASVINMPLAEFVAAAMGRDTASKAGDALSKQADLERLIAALDDEMDDRETSIPDEFVPPNPLRGRDLYHSVRAVQRHLGGTLPIGPWQAWRGMLLRADEGKGEDDPNERYERYYAYCETLSQWAIAELSRTAVPAVNETKSAEPLAEPTASQGAARPKRRGRKKADFETVQKEAALAADWERARDAGTYKGDFARERGLTIGKLDALLDRVAKRNRPSD